MRVGLIQFGTIMKTDNLPRIETMKNKSQIKTMKLVFEQRRNSHLTFKPCLAIQRFSDRKPFAVIFFCKIGLNKTKHPKHIYSSLFSKGKSKTPLPQKGQNFC